MKRQKYFRKRILSMLLSLTMIFSEMPLHVYAEGTAENNKEIEMMAETEWEEPQTYDTETEESEESDEAVVRVKEWIANLPSLEALAVMSWEDKLSAYEATQEADAAFWELTEEQQSQLTEENAKLEELFAYFNTMTAPTEDIGGSCGENATWTFDPDKGILAISGSGDMYDYVSTGAVPWYSDYRKSITSIQVGEGITSIGDCAFYWTENAASVSLPSTLTSIGKRAFMISGITNITIPASVTSIEQGAFYDCRSLSSVVFEENSKLDTIGIQAFTNCLSLTSIEIPASVTKIDQEAFAHSSTSYTGGLQTVTFEDGSGLKILEYGAFRYSDLKKITLPEGIEKIGTRAFENCTSLTAINMTGNAPTIANNALNGTSGVTVYVSGTTASGYTGGAWDYAEILYVNQVKDSNVTLNKSVYDYTGGDYAFDLTVTNYDGSKTLAKGTDYEVTYAHDLTAKTGTVTVKGINNYGGEVTRDFTIGNIYAGECGDNAAWKFDPNTGVLTISGTGIMYDYPSVKGENDLYTNGAPWSDYRLAITSVEIADGITNIGQGAFFDCDNLTSVTIPDSVTTIGYTAFYSSGITSVTLPASVKTIGAEAFNECFDLYEINLTEGLESIGNFAFVSTAITSLTIPDSVTGIGRNFVDSCKNLAAIYMTGDAPSIDTNTFLGMNKGVTIYISGTTASGYDGENWKVNSPSLIYVDQITSVDGIGTQDYIGREITPAVVVRNYKGEVLDASHYKVTYNDNTNAGTATVTITGISDSYGGKLITNFTILQKDVSIVVTDQAINYGEEISGTAYTVSGLINGHIIAVKLAADTENVTANGTIAVRETVIMAGDIDVSANYKVNTSNGILIIDPDLSAMEGLTTDNVTSAERNAIESVLEMMQKADRTNIDAETLQQWDAVISQCEVMLDKIEMAKNAANTENVEQSKDITTENVQAGDKDILEKAKEDLEKALNENSGHYSEDEKQAIQDEITRMDEALTLLEKVESVADLISRLPETAEPDDENTIRDIAIAKTAYDSLTTYEKSLVDKESQEKLENLLAAITRYKIIEGNNGTWTKGSGKSFGFVANGAYSKFTGVQVDGKIVDADYYDAASGSTRIHLTVSYLEKLSIGEHTMTVLYTDGAADGKFTILKADDASAENNAKPEKDGEKSPGTGDETNLLLWLGLMTSSIMAAGAVITARMVKNQRRKNRI